MTYRSVLHEFNQDGGHVVATNLLAGALGEHTLQHVFEQDA